MKGGLGLRDGERAGQEGRRRWKKGTDGGCQSHLPAPTPPPLSPSLHVQGSQASLTTSTLPMGMGWVPASVPLPVASCAERSRALHPKPCSALPGNDPQLETLEAKPSGKQSCARHLSSHPYFSKHIRLCTHCSLCLQCCSCFICSATSWLSCWSQLKHHLRKGDLSNSLGQERQPVPPPPGLPVAQQRLPGPPVYTLLPSSRCKRVSEHPLSCRGSGTICLSFLYPCQAGSANSWGSKNPFRMNE